MGLFQNPNHAGSWAATAAVFFLAILPGNRTRSKIVLILGLMGSLALSSSFGAMFSLACALAYIATRGRSKKALLAALSALAAIWTALNWLTGERENQGLLLGADRFARSSEGRTFIWYEALTSWLENPLGAGSPLTQSGYVSMETHNDLMGALLAYGLVGVMLLLVLLFALWRRAGMASKAILICMSAQSLFHSIQSWRHLWVWLAIALVWDWNQNDSAPEGLPEDNAARAMVTNA